MKKIFIIFVALLYAITAAAFDVKRATGSGAMSESYTKNKNGKDISEIRLHLSAAAATSENFTVYIDSATGSAYDTVLFSHDMDGVQDVVYIPTMLSRLTASNEVLMFTYTNSDARTWGLEVVFK